MHFFVLPLSLVCFFQLHLKQLNLLLEQCMLFTGRGLLRSERCFQFLHLLLLIEQLDCVLLRIYHCGPRGEIKSVGAVRKYRPWALTALEAEPPLRTRHGLTRKKGIAAFSTEARVREQ